MQRRRQRHEKTRAAWLATSVLGSEGVTALPIPVLLLQAVLPPASAPPAAGAGEGQACGDPESSAGRWESVWREAGTAEALAGNRTKEPAGAAGAQHPEVEQREEGNDGLKTALALLFLAVPESASKSSPLQQGNGAPAREPEPATLQETQSEPAGKLPVGYPPLTATAAGLEPAGGGQPEMPILPAEPAPVSEGSQPQESGQAARPAGSKLNGSPPAPGLRMSWSARPVADVLLRPVNREAAETDRDMAPPLQGRHARLASYEAVPTPLRTPQTTAGQRSVQMVAVGQPDNTGLRRATADGEAVAAARGSRVGEQPPSKESLPSAGDGVGRIVQPPRLPPGEPEQPAAPASGRMQAEQAGLEGQEPPEQIVQQRELVQGSSPAGSSPQAASPRAAQPVRDSESGSKILSTGPGEPEPPQNPARLNGQLDVQVDGQGGRRVRLRFAEAPGGVRMRVTSSDAGLAESLRAEWQTLEAALRRAGWDPQPVAVGSAERAREALGWNHGRSGESGSSEAGGGTRTAAPTAGQGQAQANPRGDNRQDGRPDGRDEIRQEWLDLSALRRLGRRRNA